MKTQRWIMLVFLGLCLSCAHKGLVTTAWPGPMVDHRPYAELGNTLYVSRIFKWYSDDFNNDIVGFFLKYAKGELLTALKRKQPQIKVDYLHYDWSLNGP